MFNGSSGTARWDDLAEAATQGEGGQIRPTAEQRILELLAAIPVRVTA